MPTLWSQLFALWQNLDIYILYPLILLYNSTRNSFIRNGWILNYGNRILFSCYIWHCCIARIFVDSYHLHQSWSYIRVNFFFESSLVETWNHSGEIWLHSVQLFEFQLFDASISPVKSYFLIAICYIMCVFHLNIIEWKWTIKESFPQQSSAKW